MPVCPAKDHSSHNEEILIDPTGDIFGDYEATSLDEDVHLVTDDETEGCGLSRQSETSDDSDEDERANPASIEAPRQQLPDAAMPHTHRASPHTVNDATQPEGTRRAMYRRSSTEELLKNKPFVVQYPTASGAGMIHTDGGAWTNETYGRNVNTSDIEGIYAPFASKLEWEFVRWAKLQGPSSTAITDLLNIKGLREKLGLTFKSVKQLNKMIDILLPGRPRFQRHEVLVGNEVCEVFYRDVVSCIKALIGDPDFASSLIYLPERHYTDESKKSRMYHDMQTGRWWWSTQEALDKDNPGGTIIPLIISSDKTQITLFRNKSAYPVYMTIGNIPKEVRRKPSARAYVLLGYLPTTKLEDITNKSSRQRRLANLYHSCMTQIFLPLQKAGVNGIHMLSADGNGRRFHPILACVVADYPEQILTTCTTSGQCPTCTCPREQIGDLNPSDSGHGIRELTEVLSVLDTFDKNPAGFLAACKSIGIKPIVDPFWKDLPYVHIYRSITPDVLHQLYQGVLKHLIKWVIQACGAVELDARCRRMPPNHNICIFFKGISSLSRVSGKEHDQMCRILLGLVLEVTLKDSLSNVRLLRAARALLDFLYLAQYPVHTDETLELLDDALECFHQNKDIFIDLGIRTSFKIPKLHWASHYVRAIKYYGTTDNYNTQYTERLHIDLTKDAYAATNHKDEFTQMTLWVERKEKILRHAQYIAWRHSGSPVSLRQEWSPPGLELDRSLSLAKHPSARRVLLVDLMDPLKYGAPFFRTAFARWVIMTNNPDISTRDLERRLWTVLIPFQHLPVWHRIKFLYIDPNTGKASTADSIHSKPANRDSKGRNVPGRFDTAYIDDNNGSLTGSNGHRIGRIKVIFSIPLSCAKLFPPDSIIPEHMAYVEWYSPFKERDPNHGLYKVTALKDHNMGKVCSVIPVANIRRSVHLFPSFGPQAPPEWTSANVLDTCDTFYVNEFSDRHFYRIISE